MNRLFLNHPWAFGAAVVLCLGLLAGVSLFKLGGPGAPPSFRQEGLAQLKQRVAQSYPALARSGTPAWQKVNLLRQWAHENMVFTEGPRQLDQDPRFQLYRQGAPAIFAAFAAGRGGVMRGGAAYAFLRLCRAYGLEAYTYSFGFPSTRDTHVITLVRVELAGKRILSLQDPTYDLYCVDPQGSPLGLWAVLKLLMERRAGLIRFHKGKAGQPKVLMAPGEAGHARVYGFDNFMRKMDQKSSKLLAQNSLPTDARYLLLFPININDGDHEVASMWREVRGIVGKFGKGRGPAGPARDPNSW